MPRSLIPLIDSLFAGILEDPPWMSFLEQLEDHLACHNSTIVLRKPRQGDPGVLISPHGNSDALSLLSERIFKYSPFLDLPPDRVCLFHEMLNAQTRPRYAEYIDYLHTFGTADLLGVNLVDEDSGITLRLRCSRAEGEPQFGSRERNLVQKLLPRLHTAMALYGRLVSQRNALYVRDAAAERLAVGSLLLNEKAEVLIKNSVADRLLEQGGDFRLERGVLRCADAGADKIFRQRLAAAIAGADDAAFRVPGGGERHWNVLLRPAPARRVALGDESGGVALMFLRDSRGGTQLSGAVFTEWFGLTRAEAALAVHLAQGHSLDEAAAALGISRYTARAQLAAVFAKTGTHRQPQLVGVLLNTVNALWS